MFDKFMEEIEVIEDDISALISSSELVYDNTFHRAIINDVNRISNEIMSSELSLYDQLLLLTIINEIHKEGYEDLKRSISLPIQSNH